MAMSHRMAARRGLRVALVAGAIAFSTPALADDTVDPDKLFAEGSALLEQNRCTEALPKLERAQKLDPGIGTQFNIAVCLQQLGRLGSAWRNFIEVEKLSRASGKKQREEAARNKLQELRVKVPRLTLRSEEPGDVVIKLDGAILPREDWGFVPVDPGEHRVEASAATKKAWATTVRAPAEGAALEVVVPKLELVQRTEIVTVTEETSNQRRTIGFVVGGIGVAGLAAAAVTGFMLLDAKSTADERCTPKCADANGAFDSEGADAVKRGQTLVPINAVAWIVAVAGIGVGGFLVLTSPSSSSKAKSAATGPQVGAMLTPQGGSLRVQF
jgi:hypothetical protein